MSIGYRLIRSILLPRIAVVLMAFAGLGWLVFVGPPLPAYLDPYVLLPGLFGEGCLTIWLLVRCTRSRWEQQAVQRELRDRSVSCAQREAYEYSSLMGECEKQPALLSSTDHYNLSPCRPCSRNSGLPLGSGHVRFG